MAPPFQPLQPQSTPDGAGGGPSFPLRRLTFHAMATACEVQYVAPAGEAQAAAFERAAVAWVQAFEAKYSRFLPTSLLSRINAAAGRDWVAVDPEMEAMLELCQTLHFMTQGVLDPTALPVLRLWNWKRETPVLPSATQVTEALSLVGWAKVKREPGRVFLPMVGMALDFGGFGKEYAVDMVARLATEHGLSAVLVDFGHDLRALGVPPGRPAWHIGLEDPFHPGSCRESVGLSGQGIASSGDYQRSFVADGRRYGHIIDPRTGRPVANGCIQATVIAGTCLQAGVLSTAAFVLGIPRGLEFIQSCPGAEGQLVAESSRAQTRGFYQYLAMV